MIRTVVSDFSRVLFFPRQRDHEGSMSKLHISLGIKHGEGYSILDHFELNEELLEFYRSLMDRYPLFILTTSPLQAVPEVRAAIGQVFKDIYVTSDFGWHKKDPTAYKAFAEKIGFAPAEIGYVDDNSGNVEAAREAGIAALQHRSNEETIKELSKALKL